MKKCIMQSTKYSVGPWHSLLRFSSHAALPQLLDPILWPSSQTTPKSLTKLKELGTKVRRVWMATGVKVIGHMTM